MVHCFSTFEGESLADPASGSGRGERHGNSSPTGQTPAGDFAADCLSAVRLRRDAESDVTPRVLAHDANNVLTLLTSAADLLTADLLTTDPRVVKEVAAEIKEGCKRLESIIRRIAKPAWSAGKALVNVNDVVSDLLRMLRHLGTTPPLVSRLVSPLPLVRIDAVDLDRAVINLLANARDATPEGGRIWISTSSVCIHSDDGLDVPAGHWVLLEVEDHGEGMDQRTLSRVFDAYFTTKAASQGTGLGLTSVLCVVRSAGGHVRIHSRVGSGTRVQLWLPPAQETTGDHARP